ncbi:SseB family protein [Pseudorhodobacter sp.]|uniref:SseB family protein n=1 Tax=Pseudorhodobacter sp. TaxID=1934400 RepID=UPI002649194E|nr:SseB family protein [Pseudorhodobacter sp.]MDN5787713.1 SseB family protein [Pseudorhodobacter sp.]
MPEDGKHSQNAGVSALDFAHAAMIADPGDDSARLRYYARLADGMLLLMLEQEAADGVIAPVVLDTEDGKLVLAFDTEERLADAVTAPVPYVELPGRVIAAQLAGQGISLGINLGVGEAEFLVSAEALVWLAETLGNAPAEIAARPIAFDVPKGLPAALMQALDAKLARAGGLAEAAMLVAVQYEDGRRGHMLAFIGAVAGAQNALTRAASEALTFSGVDAGEMDVTFLASAAPVVARMARVALRIELPQPAATAPAPRPVAPAAPGMDPSKPPVLR